MKIIDPKIFKAYDIRGIYPSEIDEDVAYKIGRAYAILRQKELPQKKMQIVVGQDMRLSSPSLTKTLIMGLNDQGADVIDIGLCSTPTFYFAIGFYGYDGGVMVSASHNPKDYNGFKMTREKAKPISGETGIEEISQLVRTGKFGVKKDKGTITQKIGVLADQVQHDLKFVNLKKIKPFKIVADAANAMGAQYLEELFKFVPGELIKINFDLDGTFPAHEADPLKAENIKDLEDRVLDEKAQLGIAPDGDGDRIFFVDNTGKAVRAEIIRGMMAQEFLKDKPGSKIAYDIRPGKITEDLILESGGTPVLTRVGHSLIKEKMLETGAYFAGESSGHYFLNTQYGAFEVPMIIILKLLQRMSLEKKSLSEIIKPYQKYFHSGEINLEVTDKKAVFQALKDKYGDAKINDLDGLTFTYDDFWFNVRGSNTEPKIRLNLEAVSKEIMEAKRDEVLKIIK